MILLRVVALVVPILYLFYYYCTLLLLLLLYSVTFYFWLILSPRLKTADWTFCLSLSNGRSPPPPPALEAGDLWLLAEFDLLLVIDLFISLFIRDWMFLNGFGVPYLIVPIEFRYPAYRFYQTFKSSALGTLHFTFKRLLTICKFYCWIFA